MDLAECIHLLPPGVCTLCNGREPVRMLIEEPPEGVTTARYYGQCYHCEAGIEPGQQIGRHRDDWIHLRHFKEE